MQAEDVTVDMLLHSRLVTKAALKPKANKYDERRRLDAIAHAQVRYAKNVEANKTLTALMSQDNEYAAWFEVFNGVAAQDEDIIGIDQFAYTNGIIQRVSEWKNRAKIAASRKGRIALALRDCNAVRQRRILRIRLQTPDWVDYDKIRAVYAQRDRISLETGIIHHVDHIIPLAGRKAVGFHVAENLQVITEVSNLKKRNNFDVDD